jgi:hypothetical protein
MNEHIIDYCREYIENEKSPQFAVFIKGDWGSGKTHLVNKIIDIYTNDTEKIKKKEIMYISLFGVNEVSEIDDIFIYELYPLLASKKMKLSASVFRSILKARFNFEFDGNEKKILFDLDKLSNKKVIIIDDFERCILSPMQIYGYFSNYLYQKGIKILFIGNEEHIAKENDIKKEEYRKIKEKTIGIEFTVIPESEIAIDYFLNDLLLNDEKYHFIKELLMEAKKYLKCNNLRIVRQCIYNLRMLIKTIEDAIIDDHIKLIAKVFINLFIQKNMDYISDKNDIRKAIIGYEKCNKNYIDYQSQNKKNLTDMMLQYIPLDSCWKDIIFDGNYSKIFLLGEYEKEVHVNERKYMKNLYILMSDWRSMDKELFKNKILNIENELQNGIYLHPGELLHYLQIMLIFSNWGLVDIKTIDLENKVYVIFNKFKSNILPVEDWDSLSTGYAGWSFSLELPEIKKAYSTLRDISNENRYNLAKDQINEDMKKLEENVYIFCGNIRLNSGTRKYYKIPFLSLVDIDMFFNIFKNLDVEYQSEIITSLEDRYGSGYNAGLILKEYEPDKYNLLKLSKLYQESISDILYNPKELFKTDLSKRLSNLLLFFDRC